MNTFFIEVPVSAILIAMIVGKSKSRITPLRVCLSSALIGFLSFICSIVFRLEMVLIQSALTFFVVGLLAACGVRRPVVVTATLTSALVGLGASLKVQHDEVQSVLDLRDDFPLTSLTDRLAYERPVPQQTESPDIELSPEATNRLVKLEDKNREEMRKYLLRSLHDEQYVAFVKSAGFGAMRMIRPARWNLKTPENKPEPLPKRPQQIDPPTAIQTPILAATEDPSVVPRLTSLHDAGLNSFTDSQRLGFVKTRQLAAGFEPHMVTRKSSQWLQEDFLEWQISRLELVSLLKFAEPRVYLSEHLPRMEELRNAETRPVDEFEQRALQHLRDGEDIVVDQQLNTIRMVGAVRAAKQCLDCHSVRRGELLGAFSYLLDRKQPLPPPKVEAKPVSMIWRSPHDS